MRLGEIKKALEVSCQTIPETYKARNASHSFQPQWLNLIIHKPLERVLRKVML